MRIADVRCHPVHLPLLRPLVTAGGVVGDPQAGAPHVYVEVVAEDGTTGLGESRPSPRWGEETLESVVSAVTRYFAPAWRGMATDDLRELSRRLDQEIRGVAGPGQAVAKAGMATAAHDLLARQRNLRLSALWGTKAAGPVALSYLISTDTVEAAERMAETALAEGYRGLDIKIGRHLDRDLELVAAVAAKASGCCFLRVDANQGYSVGEAKRAARRLGQIGVDVFEQPLPAALLSGLAEVRRTSDLPIALDESICTARGLLEAIRREAVDAVVVKVTKSGGLGEAKLIGEIAREAGLDLLGGGLTESTVGLTASAYLFDYLQITTPVDLNGPLFLADDPVRGGATLDRARILLPEGPGLGCTLDREKLARYRVK